MALTTCTIGYPRIGANRDTKKALEKYWKGDSSEQELLAVQKQVEQDAWKDHITAGIDLVGVDSTLYDQVLDTCITLGLVPERFQQLQLSGLDLYFAMARGYRGAQALDMSKYFNTNYHYLVPEISRKTEPKLDTTTLLALVQRAQATLGASKAVPMLLGPITLARLATLEDTSVEDVVAKLQPVYQQLLQRLAELKVPEVQVLEPALCKDEGDNFRSLYETTFKALAAAGVPLNLVTFYDDLGENYEWAVRLPVAAVSLDFCGVTGAAEPCQTLQLLQKHGFPGDKVLGAGVIDGRNVWADGGDAAALLAAVKKRTQAQIRVQPSCSLQHVPLDTRREAKLDSALRARLAFAVQKLGELRAVATGGSTTGGNNNVATGAGTGQKLNVATSDGGVGGERGGAQDLEAAMFERPQKYAQRRQAQYEANPNLPAFPTTTIGSFPQTAAIRRARAARKAGKISNEEHDRLMDCFISEIVGVQEGLGLDVLVHGEPERSDMVEYFGVSLEGFAFTEHGWVQSYGSRYVRPPVIFGDVKRTAAMTVREFEVAQRLTEQPVKGMLTGPVTMLNWAFARADVPRSATAMQLALAIRDEVADLEAAGCSIIQVDEPALREGLPLKRTQWSGYLRWAVDAFRLATAVAAPRTQIVTHLCYSEFGDILDAIDGLDADVLTIENSRSGDAMLRALAAAGYGRDVGPGVYDVHSPVVPSATFVKSKVDSFLAANVAGGDARRIWINPDCGLKTRGWAEVLPSLRNMVAAATELRASVAAH